MTKQEFVKCSKLIHKDRYSYDTTYCEKEKWKITCKIHGDFFQSEKSHLSGKNCPKCARANNAKTKQSFKIETFIEKANKRHNNKYDYSKVKYVNTQTPVTIIDKELGEFQQTPSAHLKTKPEKSHPSQFNNVLWDTKKFINECIRKYGHIFDFSDTEYVSMNKPIKVSCLKHGPFINTPNGILSTKHGCGKCGNRINSLEELRYKLQKIHHTKNYDYSKLTPYNSKYDTITVGCSKHGWFDITIKSHLHNGHGCQMCGREISYNKSNIETTVVNMLKNIDPTLEIITNDRSTIAPKEIDIFIPSKNLAIEINGLFWHSFNQEESEDEINKHLYKTQACHTKNIHLIHLLENEINKKSHIVESRLRNLLNKNETIIAARKCEIKEVCKIEKDAFLENNHIQGPDICSLAFGLYYENELVSIMTFSKPRFNKKYDWELIRFCNKINTSIIGGADKLFTHFKKNHSGSVISYADRRWSKFGNTVYDKLGFKFNGTTEPGYHYTKNENIYNRYSFQKHMLKNKLERFDASLTESQNMFMNGYRRIWDCGNLRYVYE